MQINNINNMIYQIQQQFNKIQNQFDSLSMSMNMNQLNLNNQISLNNNQNNNNITVKFHLEGFSGSSREPVMIQCNPKMRIREIMSEYISQSHVNNDDIKFIFNADNLDKYKLLTVEQLGITNNANIFVVKTKK